jgi:ankyrin repeat protein
MNLSPEQIKFLDAAERGDSETVNALLAGGVDVNTPDRRSLPKNRTALMHAAKGGHLDIVETLLTAGARVDEKDKGIGRAVPGGNTALLIALENKHVHIAQKLLKAGADPNVTSHGLTVLGQAAYLGDINLIRQLLKTGVDPNLSLSKKAEFPLVTALFAGRIEVVRALLSGGADPNLPRTRGRPPLEIAITEGLAEAVQLLLHRGADPDRLSPGGLTPLMMAAHYGQKPIVKILLQRDVAVNTRNRRGLTALDFAQRRLDQRPGNDLSFFLQNRGLDEPGYRALFHEIIAFLRDAGGRTSAELPPERRRARAKDIQRPAPRPTRLPRSSAPQRGVKDFLEMVQYVEPEFSVIIVKASLDKTATAFAEFRAVKKRVPDVPRHSGIRPGRSSIPAVAMLKIKRNSWTVILRSVFCLPEGGADSSSEEARELSRRLRTNAAVLFRDSSEETLGYDFFGRGMRWEHGRWTEHSSSSRFRTRFRRKPGKGESAGEFLDKIFRQQRIYVPAGHLRYRGRSPVLNVEKVSAAAVQRADVLILSRPAGSKAPSR